KSDQGLLKLPGQQNFKAHNTCRFLSDVAGIGSFLIAEGNATIVLQYTHIISTKSFFNNSTRIRNETPHAVDTRFNGF
ncbi:Hypothetical protein FKW44_011217, partial [Caligus rogercresseyi]